MNLPNLSYWQHASFRQRTDLIIIGAGLSGLCCAFHYLQLNPRASVVILEKGLYPSGASVKNAGFACFGSAGELIGDMEKEGEKTVVERVRKRITGLEGLRGIVSDGEMDFLQNGGYELFTDPEPYGLVLGRLPQLNAALTTVTASDSTFEPTSIQGFPAIFCKLEGVLHSGKVVKKLIQIVQSMGAKLITGAEVISVTTGSIRVKNEPVPLKARKIIVATNGYTSQVFPELKINPVRGYVFVTNPLHQLKWKHSFHYNKGFVYFRNLGNRLLIGGARDIDIDTENTLHDGINTKIKSWLMDFVNSVLKIEEGWAIDYEWSGIMGFNDTKNPISLEIKKDVFVLAGYSGMGVSVAFEAAKDIIDKVSE